jgi:hypothetical protein
MNHLRPEKMCQPELAAELRRLYATDPDWLELIELTGAGYRYRVRQRTWVAQFIRAAVEAMSLYAYSCWYGTGPKVFVPTREQQEALAQIDVRLRAEEYSQPFPAILVNVDCPPFNAALVCHRSPTITVAMLTHDNKNDTTTVVSPNQETIDHGLRKFDEDCRTYAAQAHRTARIAINGCLALANYEHRLSHLFPYEHATDAGLAREKTPRGERARARLEISPSLVSFASEVRLHAAERARTGTSEPTGAELRSHWRRGHWRVQRYGIGFRESKRILIKPVLVRADKFTGDVANTVTVYRG